MLRILFGRPTLEAEAQSVTMQAHAAADGQLSETLTEVAFEYQPSSNQSVLLRQLMSPGHDVPSHLHIIAGAYEVNGRIDADRLNAALQHMVVCHEALRTYFVWREDTIIA